MSAMDRLMKMTQTWQLPSGARPFLRVRIQLCNYVQNGLATMSNFALQLWVILFYNKQARPVGNPTIRTLMDIIELPL